MNGICGRDRVSLGGATRARTGPVLIFPGSRTPTSQRRADAVPASETPAQHRPAAGTPLRVCFEFLAGLSIRSDVSLHHTRKGQGLYALEIQRRPNAKSNHHPVGHHAIAESYRRPIDQRVGSLLRKCLRSIFTMQLFLFPRKHASIS